MYLVRNPRTARKTANTWVMGCIHEDSGLIFPNLQNTYNLKMDQLISFYSGEQVMDHPVLSTLGWENWTGASSEMIREGILPQGWKFFIGRNPEFRLRGGIVPQYHNGELVRGVFADLDAQEGKYDILVGVAREGYHFKVMEAALGRFVLNINIETFLVSGQPVEHRLSAEGNVWLGKNLRLLQT